jgi:hypothetical protein
MKSLIKLLFVVVIGVLVYNYFYGTAAEKETSQKVFGEVKDVWVAVGDLLKTEKQKFDDGKYDTALEKIGDSFESLKEKAKEINDSELLDKIADLDKERQKIQEKLEQTKEDNAEFSNRGEPDTYGNDEAHNHPQAEAFDSEITALIRKAKETLEKIATQAVPF